MALLTQNLVESSSEVELVFSYNSKSYKIQTGAIFKFNESTNVASIMAIGSKPPIATQSGSTESSFNLDVQSGEYFDMLDFFGVSSFSKLAAGGTTINQYRPSSGRSINYTGITFKEVSGGVERETVESVISTSGKYITAE